MQMIHIFSRGEFKSLYLLDIRFTCPSFVYINFDATLLHVSLASKFNFHSKFNFLLFHVLYNHVSPLFILFLAESVLPRAFSFYVLC